VAVKPPRLKCEREGWGLGLVGSLSCVFERGRCCSLAGGRKAPIRVSSEGGEVMDMNEPSIARNASRRAVVGRRARGGCERTLRYSKHKMLGGGWQKRPPIRVSSEGGG